MPGTVVHVSPHPDDEILGCGATLLGLRRAGWRVVNLACSLGRPADQSRRQAELAASLRLLGFEGRQADPAVPLADSLVTAVRELGAAIVASPHPGDGHPAHRAAGRAVADAGPRLGAVRWWAWGLWADLPEPNLYVPWDEDRRVELAAALACHAGELARNRYDELLPARGRVHAVLGSERVFGYGRPAASDQPYADLLTEAVYTGERWEPTPPRVLWPCHVESGSST